MLVVLVDAVRHDYATPSRMPYLAQLAAERGAARIRPLLGYSDSIRASIFTGLYPDEHGYWMEYCYRPESSPFGPLARLAPLDALPNDFVRRGLKFVLSQTVVRRQAREQGYAHLSLRHLPFRSLPVFDWTLRKEMSTPGSLGAPTLFDLLEQQRVPGIYLDSSKLGRKGLLAALDAVAPDTRLVFVYLHYVDMASHVVGIESGLFERSLARTDALLQEVVSRVGRRLGEHELLVFSDHGMAKVDRTVGYPALWRDRDFPSRFVFALDATMVRLWWVDADERLRERVRAYVASRAPGRFLERAEIASLRLGFEHRLFGDEIFLLEQGPAIFPNFHSMLRPKAMHAYHPDEPDQQGIIVGRDRPGEVAELVEILPIVADRIGLAYAGSRAATTSSPSASDGASAYTSRESERTAFTPAAAAISAPDAPAGHGSGGVA